jgi:hypothetical protein
MRSPIAIRSRFAMSAGTRLERTYLIIDRVIAGIRREQYIRALCGTCPDERYSNANRIFSTKFAPYALNSVPEPLHRWH